jgi:hypothetical protein
MSRFGTDPLTELSFRGSARPRLFTVCTSAQLLMSGRLLHSEGPPRRGDIYMRLTTIIQGCSSLLKEMK